VEQNTEVEGYLRDRSQPNETMVQPAGQGRTTNKRPSNWTLHNKAMQQTITSEWQDPHLLQKDTAARSYQPEA
jgi:hypothetical protein